MQHHLLATLQELRDRGSVTAAPQLIALMRSDVDTARSILAAWDAPTPEMST